MTRGPSEAPLGAQDNEKQTLGAAVARRSAAVVQQHRDPDSQVPTLFESSPDYVARGWIVLLMYVSPFLSPFLSPLSPIFLVGIVTNVVWYRQAVKRKRQFGRAPHGHRFILGLLLFASWPLLTFWILLLAEVPGEHTSEDIRREIWAPWFSDYRYY